MLAIIVPTLNEVENIEPLVRQIAVALPECGEIIFVDDGSSDGTQQAVRTLAREFPLKLVERAQPTLGLAGAVIEGTRMAQGEIVVVMDADLSHPPNELSNLVRPLLENRADMVIGSRYVRGGTTPGWPLYRKAMSRLAAVAAYPLTGVHDSMCGFFAIRRERLLALAPNSTGFKIAFETIVRGGKDLRVVEIPITFRDRTRGTSKMRFSVAMLFAIRWLAAVARRFSFARAPKPIPEKE